MGIYFDGRTVTYFYSSSIEFKLNSFWYKDYDENVYTRQESEWVEPLSFVSEGHCRVFGLSSH